MMFQNGVAVFNLHADTLGVSYDGAWHHALQRPFGHDVSREFVALKLVVDGRSSTFSLATAKT